MVGLFELLGAALKPVTQAELRATITPANPDIPEEEPGDYDYWLQREIEWEETDAPEDYWKTTVKQPT